MKRSGPKRSWPTCPPGPTSGPPPCGIGWWSIDGLKELTHELKGIGRNVNQLVVLANMGKIREVRLGETMEALGGIYQQLRELTGREAR